MNFDNTYASLPAAFHEAIGGAGFPAPSLVLLNESLVEALGLPLEELEARGAEYFSGNVAPEGAAPIAQVYAGHQFGHLSPRLGDGRAMLVGEFLDPEGRRWDLHLKGSGATPFSRGGDGRATLGPVLREYLMGEAMHTLGIPTTRALAAVTTGEPVRREQMLPGAVLARVASSHLRVGTFVYFAARRMRAELATLADYAVARHVPDAAKESDSTKRARALLSHVVDRQAELIARWMGVGFVHGVMNTDNVTISGETIDYGPCAFMEAVDPRTVFSSIDHHGRYAYGNQPGIGAWNLARFAEALLPLLAKSEGEKPSDAAIEIANEEMGRYAESFQRAWRAEMGAKLGLAAETLTPDDDALGDELMQIAHSETLDFTTLFRDLSRSLRGIASLPPALAEWEQTWRARLATDGREASAVADAMDAKNPLYIPRNHLVEEALDAAVRGDLAPFAELLDVLARPFEAQEGRERFAQPAPESFGPHVTFCGT